jgi:hypothetical protein
LTTFVPLSCVTPHPSLIFRFKISGADTAFPFLSVKHILLVDIYTDLLQLTENDHLDILSAIDLHEN